MLRNIVAEILALTSATLGNWVNVPANATGPLDPNVTLTTAGTELVEYIATIASKAMDMICAIFQATVT